MTNKEAVEILTFVLRNVKENNVNYILSEDLDPEALEMAINALTVTDHDGPHWYKNKHTFWTCSECGFVNNYNRKLYKFCPDCGAYLGGFKYEGT